MIQYFIAGFLIAFFFDNIYTILSYLADWVKATISVKIARKQSEIAKISEEINEQEPTRAIGFTIPDDDWGDLDE